ncbi:hypothetical protein ACFX19_009953 [Malus domestica]
MWLCAFRISAIFKIYHSSSTISKIYQAVNDGFVPNPNSSTIFKNLQRKLIKTYSPRTPDFLRTPDFAATFRSTDESNLLAKLLRNTIAAQLSFVPKKKLRKPGLIPS